MILKKLLIGVWAVLFILQLTACGESSGINETTKNPIGGETSTSTIYNQHDDICETPTRLIYISNAGQIMYYNKLDGGTYPLCFDPVCKHSNRCVSRQINSFSPIRYDEAENRLYAFYEDSIFSMSFDASDVRIEYSADLAKNTPWFVFGALELYNGYAYFTMQDLEAETYSLYRLHLKTKKLENLTENTELTDINEFKIGEDGMLYLWARKEASTFEFYRADADLNNIEKLAYMDWNCYFIGDYIYAAETEHIEGLEYLLKGVNAHNMKTGEITPVFELNQEGNGLRIMAMTDRYVYYQINDRVVIGQQKTGMGRIRDVNASQYNIYRYDRETGEHLQVYYNLYGDIEWIYLMEDSVMMDGMTFYQKGDYYDNYGCRWIADIDENGMFVNIREITDNID